MNNFNIIRYRGQVNKAKTLDGYDIIRQDKLFIPDYGMVTCAPYEEHFLYKEPNPKKIGSIYMCTCGSPAIVTGLSGYVLDASPQGKMLVCMLHATTGKHTNSQARWI